MQNLGPTRRLHLVIRAGKSRDGPAMPGHHHGKSKRLSGKFSVATQEQKDISWTVRHCTSKPEVMTPRGTCARDFLASPTSFGRSATPARSLANQRSSICRIKGCYVADLARHPMGSCASSGSN
ncbi:hypothetical protein WJX84_001829 [Apatococcus fuscideae]|uniref:Uncharacterized protein n=1 Tax=Apatococcus fuscideae TaxID=2026836 RepID=A0AAW1SMH8_9CHLO